MPAAVLCHHMRLALCLSILMASSGWAADEAADRAAIEKVISTLNSSPSSHGLFTEDFADGAALTSLGIFRDGPRANIRVGAQCVSHEPWGELGWCPAAMSRFDIQSVRLITTDVALVDAVNERGFGAGQPINGQRAPLRSAVLLVLRKEGDAWKIASLRVMAQPGPATGQ
jgi:hypothetical protein